MIDECVYKVKLNTVLSLMDKSSPNIDVGCGNKRYTSKIPDCIGVDPKLEFEGTINNPDFCVKGENLGIFKDSMFANHFLLDTLEHSEDPKQVIKEAYRVLKTRGCMVIIDPNDFLLFIARILAFRFKDAIRGNPDHRSKFNQSDLVNLVFPFFILEKTKRRFIFNGYKFRSNKL
jgi:SAM-dependent methyltransferase